ncbi:hypothetical protein [Mycobacterium sp. ACS1612]|uniref:hypothetical protein n=1 Tax=Mycobacterium sp. ACS1612 TaxID=1834117 RepID=UPI0012EA8E03|nr:hypothetical protein [Mycobacterium sp. ACS1612]
MRYRKGDSIIARRRIEGMNVPEVPVGSVGTVESTTVLGKPKKVHFSLATGWGPKRFTVDVRRGDVEAVREASG